MEGRLNAATVNTDSVTNGNDGGAAVGYISVGRVVGRDLVRIAIDLTEYSEIKS